MMPFTQKRELKTDLDTEGLKTSSLTYLQTNKQTDNKYYRV